MHLRDLKLRALALFRPRRVERELDDELAFHLECETRKLVEDRDALGQVVRMKVDLPSPAILKSQTAAPGVYTVVGVARDIGMRLQVLACRVVRVPGGVPGVWTSLAPRP